MGGTTSATIIETWLTFTFVEPCHYARRRGSLIVTVVPSRADDASRCLRFLLASAAAAEEEER